MYFKIEKCDNYTLLTAEKGVFDAKRLEEFKSLDETHSNDNLIVDLRRCFDIEDNSLTALEDIWGERYDRDKSCIFVYHDFEIQERLEDDTPFTLTMEDALITLEDEEALRD
jgi:hypothetical protein